MPLLVQFYSKMTSSRKVVTVVLLATLLLYVLKVCWYKVVNVDVEYMMDSHGRKVLDGGVPFAVASAFLIGVAMGTHSGPMAPSLG